MTVHAFRIVALLSCLAVLSGCRSAPDNARSQMGDSSSPARYGNDGWLWQRATGQGQPAGDAAGRDQASGVRQASATEPAPPGQGPVKDTIIGARDAPMPALKDDDEKEFDISSLAPENLYKKAKVLAGYGPNEAIARQAFEEGRKLFDQKEYAEAAKKFATAADRWPDTPLEEDAMFLLAESYFFSDQYMKAEDAYEALLKKHSYSRYVDKAVARQFAIGRYWEQHYAAEPHWPVTPNFTDNSRPLFDTWGHAIKAYEHVRLNDPTGPLADDSLMATGNAYFGCGRYEDAAFEYDTLLKEYPKSEHGMHASLLCLEAKQRVYQGPLYDGKALKDAGEVADQTLTRYGPSLGPKKELVVEAKNQIVEQKAQREWAIGQYYDRNGYYGAARIYYRGLIESFPQTQIAQAARKRMDEIKDLSAEPPNYFGWLDKVVNPKKHRVREGGGGSPAPTVAGQNGG